MATEYPNAAAAEMLFLAGWVVSRDMSQKAQVVHDGWVVAGFAAKQALPFPAPAQAASLVAPSFEKGTLTDAELAQHLRQAGGSCRIT